MPNDNTEASPNGRRAGALGDPVVAQILKTLQGLRNKRHGAYEIRHHRDLGPKRNQSGWSLERFDD